MQNAHPSYHGENPGIPIAAMQQGGIRPANQWNRNKSISEANLLAAEYGRTLHVPPHPHMRDPRRNSVAEFGHHHELMDHRFAVDHSRHLTH
jgi:hypothetical protein